MVLKSWMFCLLLLVLPVHNEFEIGNGKLLMKMLSALTNSLRPPEEAATSSAYNNEEFRNNDSDPPLTEEEQLLWRGMLNDIMNDTNDLGDKMYEENEDDTSPRFGETESVDCYGLPKEIGNALKFLFKKDSKEIVNTRFFLSTRNSRNSTELKDDSNVNFLQNGFYPTRRTIFIIHGFMSNGNMDWVKNLTNALLDNSDANVIAVDWSGGGGSWQYWKAVANTRVTGFAVTKFIWKLMELGLTKDNIHLIGHSLGAHICSYISSHLGGVDRITGLDPAQPCFQDKNPEIRLDPTDARFIDVIHTNGRLLSQIGLGLPEPIGHVDFYPNGGAKQPGCSMKKSAISLPVLSLIKDRIEKSICSHGRSYMFFIESLKREKACSFWGHRWNTEDRAGTSALNSPCNIANCTEMGIESDVFPARGSFYVLTQPNYPYCMVDRKTDTEMISSLTRLYNRVSRHKRILRNIYSRMKKSRSEDT